MKLIGMCSTCSEELYGKPAFDFQYLPVHRRSVICVRCRDIEVDELGYRKEDKTLTLWQRFLKWSGGQF